MPSGEPDRIHAGLYAMLFGKLLYKREEKCGDIIESVLFIDPEDTQQQRYVTMTFTYNPYQKQVQHTDFQLPAGIWVVSGLGANGDYSRCEELPLEHPEAQRVLKMYRSYALINQLRIECDKHLIDPTRTPPPPEDDPDPNPGSSSVPNVEYA